MNKTPNFALNQWESTDRILMADFNADNAKLDAALAAQQAALAALNTAVAKLGNCQLYFTTYTGSGTYGAATPNSLTFPKQPYLILIQSPEGSYLITLRGAATYQALMSGSTNYFSGSITWSGNTVSWHGSYAHAQMNTSKDVYRVLALLAADE